MIALLGLAAIWLSQSRRESRRRYACVFGMIGQPFWFWSSIQAEQWGIFILSCFYTIAWAKGIKNYWLKRPRAEGSDEHEKRDSGGPR
ncbi:hypothetical protein [Pseudomonas eucalypticola]|uniref:Uncharacterized protein n=1 Tax=Pseudomonas eucalypticola TaxID=2599595 RepID=A0A7D5H7A0_9PSED|nr:hypothetical protein [Pseudomonas eucalypticola]QKZ05829.1 hypothetical protein HWQ56_19325 [Pseudomonas eucalypticola]